MNWFFGAKKMSGSYAGPHVNCRFGGELHACFGRPSLLFGSFRASRPGGKGILSALQIIASEHFLTDAVACGELHHIVTL